MVKEKVIRILFVLIFFLLSFKALSQSFPITFTIPVDYVSTAHIEDEAVDLTKLSSLGVERGSEIRFDGTGWSVVAPSVRGLSENAPAASCSDALDSGYNISGKTWVDPAGDGSTLKEVYCEQVLDGGGYVMIYNSILGAGTMHFWKIAKLDALTLRKGTPDLGENFYDGSLYLAPSGSLRVMDVVEGLRGKEAIMFIATATGIDSNTASPTYMHFQTPAFVSGRNLLYTAQFAGGWSSYDHDGDNNASNCAANWSNVTQHYDTCFRYSLGSDADAPVSDYSLGPHAVGAEITPLGLTTDGTSYSRVRRITRFIKW